MDVLDLAAQGWQAQNADTLAQALEAKRRCQRLRGVAREWPVIQLSVETPRLSTVQ
jgi:hypothetical protein